MKNFEGPKNSSEGDKKEDRWKDLKIDLGSNKVDMSKYENVINNTEEIKNELEEYLDSLVPYVEGLKSNEEKRKFINHVDVMKTNVLDTLSKTEGDALSSMIEFVNNETRKSSFDVFKQFVEGSNVIYGKD